MNGNVWNFSLRNRVVEYLRQGFGSEDIVAFLGRKNRDQIVREIRRERERCQKES
jgi:hypothetical protein